MLIAVVKNCPCLSIFTPAFGNQIFSISHVSKMDSVFLSLYFSFTIISTRGSREFLVVSHFSFFEQLPHPCHSYQLLQKEELL